MLKRTLKDIQKLSEQDPLVRGFWVRGQIHGWGIEDVLCTIIYEQADL